MDIDFWFDPACPFCWRTSRWLVAVAPDRDVTIHWRSISLLEKNGGVENVPEQFRARVTATHRMLRVVERLRERGAGELIGPFYTEVGTQIHHDQLDAQDVDVDVAAVLSAVGADALELFDAWRTMVTLGVVWELKRGREGVDMSPPPRPNTVIPRH